MTIQVVKRDGSREPLDINKIHTVVNFACEGINGVSSSEIELKSQLLFFDGIKTTEIQETLIKAAAELISLDNPNYQYVAANLINYHLRKEVYNSIIPPHIYQHVKHVVDQGFYTPELLEWYSEDEFNIMQKYIDHDRDYDLVFVGIEQFREKYLVKNRVTGKIYETPQMAYMLIAACLFSSYPKEKRMEYVRNYYDMISQHYISLPTPIMAGVRTKTKQFSSCVLINSGDSLDSIISTTGAVTRYVANRAGIGINVGRIRAKGSPVRNGEAFTTGLIPYLKMFAAATKSASQGAIRDGSTTVYCPIWHMEIEDYIVLKNNKGTEDNRIRHMDYSVQINKLFYERLISGGDITLFCPNDVPDVYEAFFSNQEKFKELYEKAERNTRLKKKKIKAIDLFSAIMQERKETGRIYIMNVDHSNEHGAFKSDVAPIYQSNLCLEILLPNTYMGDNDSLIALCTLSAINWGKIEDPKQFESVCDLTVRGLDALLDYQNYPMEEAKKHTMFYRPLGIGITNLAYFMAKRGLTYDGNQETYDVINEYAEAWSYYMYKASVNLAKEYGSCSGISNLKACDGILPIDTYTKYLDEIVSSDLKCDWESLRRDIKEYGIRNSTLLAIMPAETSSQILNSTNGIEPPRGHISFKQSKNGVLKQLVAGSPRMRKMYQLLWDIKSPKGYLTIAGIINKYCDQAISTNTSYNPKYYKDEKIPMSEMLKDLLYAYKLGIKTLYYFNTNDGSGDESLKDETTTGCDSGACAI